MLDTQTIKEQAYALGFDIARVTTAQPFPEAKKVIKERIGRGLMDGLSWFTAERADVSCHPEALLPTAQSIISLGMVYLTEMPENAHEGTPRGRIARYAWGDDYHDIIKPKLKQFAEWLREYARSEVSQEDFETRLFVDTGRMVDRAVAQRAGLGWYGKNTNILTHGWGSWLFLAEIVTNLPLTPDEPLKANCGNCEICLHACPTGALPNPYELDNTRCISFLTIELRGSIPLELRPLMGTWIFGCDICQEVCPVNKVAERRLGVRQEGQKQMIAVDSITRRKSGPFQPHQEYRVRPAVGSTPELLPLLELSEEEFRERFRRSPIRRTKRRGLLRNVCVALGNIRDPQAVPALIKALHDDDPLIRGHAAWALGQIGGEQATNALQERMQTEEDSEVQKEIRCALTELVASS
ncbi:epoxyqueuosine reductase [Thermosporothrix hazakensis]|jgi:epoxyqueuosine reductase|uniref:Epoxyqueuosine reductase n=1 Tax=Thermosporothrix hazakensis TaxID=644383 RepID=A0A326U3B7_THEHA|nr:tRNA epoxyqueuosine(34) reductase QueG [Thermosporothrix hazakensis]PZW26419.1 epoxyqueuosine reductase [Thermosporothrix hazakensis]GCE48630.1 epoxyqueuosine reductase [Thermosporothrix hazakensis]